MENFIDDNEAYFKLKAKCRCDCTQHCGHSCMTDDCDCTECSCPNCAQTEDRVEIGRL